MAKPEAGASRKRKPRGRGLRATTGCIICKRRHVKCDETRPQCGPCAIGDRPCVYTHDITSHADKPGCLMGPGQNSNGKQKFHKVLFSEYSEVDQSPGTTAPDISATVTETSWKSDVQISLSKLELYLFQHFVHTVSKLLDFQDTESHFGTVVPHLALRNVGLMKALLALSARHIFLGVTQRESTDTASYENEELIDRNLIMDYFTESLHYLNLNMQYPPYTQSLELITTAMLISTFEMIDGQNQNWEKHIKGIFWIQRFQDNDGETSGLRSAVWWAWLQQDTWIAILEKRRVHSLWKPTNHISSLGAPELARRASYLLAQCVNYASEEERREDSARRADRGNELLHLLQEWREVLPSEYFPLPLIPRNEIFPEIWIHPASYAAALQIQSLALILVVLNHPSLGVINEKQKTQHMINASVSTICGIARCVDMDDFVASFIALKCLYGAAMCVHAPQERLALLDLLESRQNRLHWPAKSLREELELDYPCILDIRC